MVIDNNFAARPVDDRRRDPRSVEIRTEFEPAHVRHGERHAVGERVQTERQLRVRPAVLFADHRQRTAARRQSHGRQQRDSRVPGDGLGETEEIAQEHIRQTLPDRQPPGHGCQGFAKIIHVPGVQTRRSSAEGGPGGREQLRQPGEGDQMVRESEESHGADHHEIGHVVPDGREPVHDPVVFGHVQPG